MMSLSVVEQFNFNGKKVQSVHVEGESASSQETFTMQLDTRKKMVKQPFKI